MTVPRVAEVVCTGRFRTPGVVDFRYWRQAVASAPFGSSNMTVILVCTPTFGARSQSGDTITDFGAGGFRLLWDPPPTGWRFQLRDGGGAAQIVSQAFTVPALEERRFYVVTAFYRSAVEFGIRVSGVGTTTAAAPTGYTPQNGPKTIGADAGGTVGTPWRVAAVLADDTVGLTSAQRAVAEAAIIDDLEQGRTIRSGLLSANEIYWDARDCDYTLGTWAVRRGTANQLARTGTPAAYGFPARFSRP